MIKKPQPLKHKLLMLCLTLGTLGTSCSKDANSNDIESSSCPKDVNLPELALGTYISSGGDGFTSETATISVSDSGFYTISFNNDIDPLVHVPLCGVEVEDLDGTAAFLFNFEDDAKKLSITIASKSNESTLVIIKESDPKIFFGGKK